MDYQTKKLLDEIEIKARKETMSTIYKRFKVDETDIDDKGRFLIHCIYFYVDDINAFNEFNNFLKLPIAEKIVYVTALEEQVFNPKS